MIKYGNYGNRIIYEDGYKFDSLAETKRYRSLKLLEQTGEISDLEVHPAFELQPKFKYGRKAYRAITYKADFSYLDKKNGWRHTVEDIKGFSTKTFRLKLHLLLYKYPDIDFRIIDAHDV